MADLPECRITICNIPFKFCDLDYFGPYYFRERLSNRKAWGLLFTCLCTRCLHVEVVTSLDLNSFLLAFSRFTNLRGAVDTFYSDDASTFCAAADRLPELLSSIEFQNSLRKSDINWIKIPPYSSSQGGVWEIMVNRGGVEDTRLEAKDTKKSEAKAKDSLSEDRPSRGQGQEFSRPRPRTKDTAASVFQKKKVFKKVFRQSPIYRRSQNF